MSTVLIWNRPFKGDDKSESSEFKAVNICPRGNLGETVTMSPRVCAEAVVPPNPRSTVRVFAVLLDSQTYIISEPISKTVFSLTPFNAYDRVSVVVEESQDTASLLRSSTTPASSNWLA